MIEFSVLVGSSALHAPKVASAEIHAPLELRCSDSPTGVEFDSSAPMSTDVTLAAGPLLAANVPS